MANNVTFGNWTDLNLTSVDLDNYIYHINFISHMFSMVVSLLTVVLNGFVLYCLRTHRTKVPDVIFMQTVCLSVTDLLAGLAPATHCLTLLENIYRSVMSCFILWSVFSVAQFAVLLNLCLLSLRRWIILKRASQHMSRFALLSKSAICNIICPWLASFLSHLPFVLFRFINYETNSINGCTSPDLFKNRKMLFIFCSFYTGTLFLLNAFYISSMAALKRFEKSHLNNFQGRNQRIQQKAFKHLLAIILATNATTLPLIAILVLMNIKMERNPERIFFLFQLPALNSLFNPILYSLQVVEIRCAMRENSVSLLHKFRSILRRNNTIAPTDSQTQW